MADPQTLALGPWGVGGGGSQQALNPLGMLGEVMKLRQTGQEWAARQRYGEIASANAGDMEATVRAAQADPLVAPFAPQLLTEARQQQMLQYQVQGLQLGQARDGRQALTQLLTAVDDPSKVLPTLQRGFETFSPILQKDTKPYGDSINAYLTEGLPSDPAAAKATFAERKARLMIGSGIKPEEAYASVGSVWMPPQVTRVPTPTGPEEARIVGGALPIGGALAPGAGGGTAGGTGTGGILLGRGLSPGEAEEQKTVAAKASDLQAEISDNASHIPITVSRVDMMQDALKGFQAGGGAFSTARLTIAELMQGAKNAGLPGITQEAIDRVGNQSLSDNQVFNSQIKPFVISSLKESAQGTGRVMKSEVQAFLEMADQAKDPVALMRILNLARKSLQIGYDKSVKFPDFRQALARKDPSVEGLNLMDFYSWYNRNYNEKNLIQTTPGGMQLGPRPEHEAKGAAAGGASVRYDPATKTFVPIVGP